MQRNIFIILFTLVLFFSASSFASENYIGTDEFNSDVPDYGNFNISHTCSAGGICGASGAAAVLAYWDTHTYNGTIYWNIIDNGTAPFTQARNANGPNVDGLVEWLVDETYCVGYSRSGLNSAIEDVCNDSNYENDLDFDSNLDDWFPTYSNLKDEIDSGKPLLIALDSDTGGAGHVLPVWGYKETTAKMVRVHSNSGDWNGIPNYDWIDWDGAVGDWPDYDTGAIWRITPGGGSDDPHDHYEDDDSYSTSNWLDPDATHNFLQTHNFHDSGDNDWIKFNAVSGRRYTIETKNLGAQCDTVIYLYNKDGTTEITHDDDGGSGAASKIIWDCISPYTSGTYFVKIEEYYSRGGPTTNFDIEIDWDYSPTSSSTTTIGYSSSSTTTTAPVSSSTTYQSSSTTTIGNSSSSTTTIGYSSSSTTTIGYSSSSTTTTSPVSSTTTYQSSSTTTTSPVSSSTTTTGYSSTTTTGYSSSSTTTSGTTTAASSSTTTSPFNSTTTYQHSSTTTGGSTTSVSSSSTTTAYPSSYYYINKDDFTCGGNSPCYSNIQEAIDAAGPVSTIKVVQGFYDEDVTLNTSKTLDLQGGWDSTFTTQSSNTTINSLAISSGTIVPSNIILQPAGATISLSIRFYEDFLDRRPEPGTIENVILDFIANSIDTNGDGSCKDFISDSGHTESVRNLITHFYETILGREPESWAVEAWEHGYFNHSFFLNTDVHYVAREMGRLFFLSEEYELRNRSNAEFINDCSQAFLNQSVSEMEQEDWICSAMEREEVVATFANSDGFAKYIDSLFH